MKIITQILFSTCKKTSKTYVAILGSILVLFGSAASFGQINSTMQVRGDINSFNGDNMTYRTSPTNSWKGTILASATNATSNFLFTPSSSYTPKWGAGSAISINTKSTVYASGGNSTYNQISGKYYTFIMPDVAGGSNTTSYIFETSAIPVSVSTVAQSVLASSVTVGQTVAVTASTSASLPTGQGVFLRYSNNAFATSTVVNMTGSGTTYTANIPSGTNTAGANVVYYVFTSGGTTAPAAADCDLATINLNNNAGSNYTYTVNTPATVYLHNFNDVALTQSIPYTTSPTATTGSPTGVFNANLNSSSWTTTAQTTFTTFAGSGSTASLSVSGVTGTQTYTLTFSVASGNALSVNSFNLWANKSGTGPTNFSMTINGISAAGSTAVPSGASTGTINVLNPVNGLSGTITVVLTLTGGTGGTFRLDDFTLTGNVVAQPGPPSLNTPTATVTLPTAATLGATVTSNGGAALSARGTSYKTTAGVAATDNQLAEGGTTVSAFTHSRTGLNPQTQYFYAGYATNANGTSLSPEANFRTWSNPATVQPATFTTAAGSSSLTANWGTATFPGSGATQAGYIVIYATGTPTLTSANGVAPAAGVGTLINIGPTVLPTAPALTTTISSLTNGTLYNLLIVPYTWDGTNASTYNYFTAGAKTTTGTPVATSYIWSGGGSGAWTTGANWTPTAPTGGPSSGDSVTFNLGSAIAATSVPTVTLNSITLANSGTVVTLSPASTANTIITLSNAGTSLSIPTGTTLNLIGNTTNTRTMTMNYSGSGNIATVAGTLNLKVAGTAGASYSAINSTTTVSGVMSNNYTGTITSTSSNLIISGTGKFQLAGLSAAVPTANWNANSILEFANTYSASTTVTGLGQSFSYVTVNATGLTGASTLIQCGGALTSIAKDLTITSTGAGAFSLQQGTTLVTTTIGGAYIQTGGGLDFSNGSSSGATNVNVAGSISVSGTGTIGTNGTVRNGAFVLTGTGTQTVTFATPANITYTNFTVNSGATMKLGSNIILNNSSTANYKGTILTNSGGNFDAATFTVTPGAATAAGSIFTISAGATFSTGNSGGVIASVPTSAALTTTLPITANYVFNGALNQITSSTLPATVNTLTINNTGTSPTNVVTLSAITAITATANSLTLTAGKLDLNSKQLTISNGGNAVATSGDFTATAGPLYFIGTGTVSGTVNFPTVRLSGGVDFGASSTIVTSMLMESGSFITTNAPTYGSVSTLIYNNGGSYGRNLEWSATSGKGYPNHVQIQNGTTVDLSANGFADRAIAGNLNLGIVGSASAGSLTLGATTNKLTVGGNVVIGGNTSGTSTLTLSSVAGGDVHLSGNWDVKNMGVFASNSRAVFFEGIGTSVVTGTPSFDYLLVNKTSNGTVSLTSDLTINNALTLNAQLVTNAFKVIVPNLNTVTANANGWVRGTLQKNIPTGSTTRTFEIGGVTNYRPVTLAYTGVTNEGLVTASTTSGDNPNIETSGIDSTKSVNRYTTLRNDGVAGGSYNPTFTFVPSDLDAGANYATFGISTYSGSTWTPLTIGTRTATTTQATGVTLYGDFQIGESKTNWTAGAGTTAWTTPGNWSNGVPTASTNTYISTASFYPEITSDVAILNLTINPGTSVTVKSNFDLTVTDVIANGGTLTIENKANLVQTNNIANTGKGATIVKRDSSALKRLDYTLWSSPVTGQGLYDFSKFTLPNRFYIYNTSSDLYSNSVGFGLANLQFPSPLVNDANQIGVNGTDNNDVKFENGKGYLIRVPYNHPTTPAAYSGTFIGVANNGDISAPVSTSLNGYNAVGNPYPSRLSIPAFIDGNTNITGTLYFWRKTNNAGASTSYATLTKTAYVANSSAGGDTGATFFESGDEANWVTNIGQGFIVQATSGSAVNFTNSMRRSSNTNQFFRNAQTTNAGNNGLYWLNLADNTGFYSQMAVGYSSEGTLGFDRGIDGENINREFYLTSLIGTDEYAIQGRADFDSSDIVPLSYKATTSGNFTISIDHTAGAFTAATQAIYLKDNLTNTINNLNTAGYTFASEVGTFSNRFEIVYQTQLTNPTFTANTVVIYSQNNEFAVTSGNSIMASIKVFDIRGRMIEEKNAINSNQTTFRGGLSNQVLLVQITSEDGVVVTKKVVR